MFQELIEFFKRFVIAHEKMAEAQMLTTRLLSAQMTNGPQQPTGVDPAGYGQSDGTECTAGGLPPAETTQQSPAGTPAPDWNPYTSPVMKQYKGEKQGILKAELAKFGLDVGAKMTGAQMHELLLEKAKNAPKAEPAEPSQAVLPGAPVAPVMAPPATMAQAGQTYEAVVLDDATSQQVSVVIHSALADQEIGMNQLRAALNLLCKPGGEAPVKAAGIIQRISGATRLTDAATGQRLIADNTIVPIFRALMDALEGRG